MNLKDIAILREARDGERQDMPGLWVGIVYNGHEINDTLVLCSPDKQKIIDRVDQFVLRYWNEFFVTSSWFHSKEEARDHFFDNLDFEYTIMYSEVV